MHKKIKVLTEDGVQISALLFSPKSQSKGVILFCPGLGIPKEFYLNYCEFLRSSDYRVLVFDYRGIGKDDLREKTSKINLTNWPLQDIPACINYILREFPSDKIYYVGHSVAGQIAGLVPNIESIDRFVFFCSTGGHYRLFEFPLNLFTFFMFYVHIPIVSTLFGHLPKGLTYRGVAISKGVAKDWAMFSRHPLYFRGFVKSRFEKDLYEKITQKIDWISFSDDPIATSKALKFMMGHYKNAPISHHQIDPKSLSLSRIGHSGFFNKKKGRKLWEWSLGILNS